MSVLSVCTATLCRSFFGSFELGWIFNVIMCLLQACTHFSFSANCSLNLSKSVQITFRLSVITWCFSPSMRWSSNQQKGNVLPRGCVQNKLRELPNQEYSAISPYNRPRSLRTLLVKKSIFSGSSRLSRQPTKKSQHGSNWTFPIYSCQKSRYSIPNQLEVFIRIT